MRNAVAATVLALVLIAGLFTVVRFGGRPALRDADTGVADPARVAAQIKDGFLGERKIGAWQFNCGRRQELPKAKDRSNRNFERSKRASEEEDAPAAEWKIPRCRVYQELDGSGAAAGNIRITYRRAGLNRALSLFVRFPRSDVDVGDSVTLRMDKSAQAMTVQNCAEMFCLVREPIKKGGPLSLIAAKAMILQYTKRPSGKRVSVSVPTRGLDQAVAAMVRIEK